MSKYITSGPGKTDNSSTRREMRLDKIEAMLVAGETHRTIKKKLSKDWSSATIGKDITAVYKERFKPYHEDKMNELKEQRLEQLQSLYRKQLAEAQVAEDERTRARLYSDAKSTMAEVIKLEGHENASSNTIREFKVVF